MNIKDFDYECIFCGSEKLEYDTIEPEGENVTQEVECMTCGREFVIFSGLHWQVDTDDYPVQ